MKSAIEVIGKSECTGCFGCVNACPISNAIEMKFDNEGFYKANITNYCIHCGKCQKFCPIIDYSSRNLLKKVYAAWSLDSEILKKSSSGGIFSELSKFILSNNGIVYGAAWKDGRIVHIKISKMEDIYQLQGSKYLPSNINLTYTEVMDDLKKGKKVLYSGLPCQIAALQKVVSSANLFTLDVICHGIPSQKVFDKYLKEMNIENFKSVSFRDKEKGWSKFGMKYYSKNGEKVLETCQEKDVFFRGFMKDIYLSIPCYKCKFKGDIQGNHRIGDITLADFWGIEKKLENNDLGVSLVITNNLKGERLFYTIKKDIFYQEVLLKKALKWNKSFYQSPTINKNRKKFFQEIDHLSIFDLERKYYPTPSILNRYYYIFRNNIKKIIKVMLEWIGVEI